MPYRLLLILPLLLIAARADGQLRTPVLRPDPGPALGGPHSSLPLPVRPGGLPAGGADMVELALFGAGGGMVGAVAVGGLVYASTAGADGGEYAGFDALLAGTVLGYPLGSAVGVYLRGRHRGGSGSPAWTVVGAALGMAVGGMLVEPTGGISYLLGPPLGAALGYHGRGVGVLSR